MNVGDRVTIVHGPGPEGSITRNTPGTVVLPIVHGRPAPPSPVRRDGMVAVRPDGSPHDVWIWVDPMYLDQGLLETSPRHRVTDPDTARAAADSAGERLTEHQLLVLEALAHAGRAGLIDHEHEARNGLIPTSAGKRRKELERLGLCEPTDQKRPTSRSALAIVHRVTARGLAVWQSHQQKGAA